MKHTPFFSRFLTCTAAFGTTLGFALGASYTWEPDQISPGGSGNWDTTSLSWLNTGTFGAWNNAANDSAAILGASGTISVTTPITALRVDFAGGNTFVLQGSTITITQAGFTNAITTASNNTNATINNAISFVNSINTNAGGSANVLTFGGSMTYTGVGSGQLSIGPGAGSALTNFNGNILRGAGAGSLSLNVGSSAGAAGTVVLAGNNAGVNNGMTLGGGTVVLKNSNAIASGGITLSNVSGASTSALVTGTSGLTIANAITVATNAGDTTDSRAIGGAHTSGTSTYTGGITLNAQAQSAGVIFTSTTGGVTVFSNTITGAGKVTVSGGGEVRFTRAAGNTYTGNTVVTAGTLMINNTSNSGAGTGTVSVNAGTLAGAGSVSGAVTIGDGAGSNDSFIAPGAGAIGTFTTGSTLSLASDATFRFELNSTASTADQLVAAGVTLNASSQFSFTDLGAGTIAVNTQFVIINNTSGSAISGAFANLADGSTFTSGANQFQVSYSGGTGSNDLVLTVVPEPSTVALLGVGLAAALRIGRHVRRK